VIGYKEPVTICQGRKEKRKERKEKRDYILDHCSGFFSFSSRK
jgi:hypothetical protein